MTDKKEAQNLGFLHSVRFSEDLLELIFTLLIVPVMKFGCPIRELLPVTFNLSLWV